jgi:hypothetical protein
MLLELNISRRSRLFFGVVRFEISNLITSEESLLFVPITPVGPLLAQPTT